MANGRESIKVFLTEHPDTNEVIEATYSMYNSLENFHKMGYYAEKLNFDTITFSQTEGNVKAFEFGVMNTSSDNDEFRNKCFQNVRDLTYTSLGMFAYIYSSEFQPSNPALFDYSRISKQDSNFVPNNYGFIRDSIPYGKEFFDDFMNGNYDYFNHFVDQSRLDSQSRNSSKGSSYVKTTPYGKGYGEEDNNQAYAKVWIYPVVILCFTIICFVTYMLYKFL